jgi:hypothetical protein
MFLREWARFIYSALFCCPQLVSQTYKVVPSSVTHTVSNVELQNIVKVVQRRCSLSAPNTPQLMRSARHNQHEELGTTTKDGVTSCGKDTGMIYYRGELMSAAQQQLGHRKLVRSRSCPPRISLKMELQAATRMLGLHLEEPLASSRKQVRCLSPRLKIAGAKRRLKSGAKTSRRARTIRSWANMDSLLHSPSARRDFSFSGAIYDSAMAQAALTQETPRGKERAVATAVLGTPRACAMGLARPAPRPSRREKRLVVALDVDECLIHSVLGTTEYRQAEERPESVGKVNHISVTLEDGEIITVNKRPGLLKFLEAVSIEFYVVAFTAGKVGYADKVLEALDPEGKIFKHKLYRTSCFHARGGVFLKDLDRVVEIADCPFGCSNESWTCKHDALARTVLVDNSPLSFIKNPDNGILVSSWFDDEDDNALFSVLQLLRYLDQSDDVRPTLRDLFGLSSVLKEYRNYVLQDDGWKPGNEDAGQQALIVPPRSKEMKQIECDLDAKLCLAP